MPALLAENVLAFLIERALRRQVRWYRRKFSVLICVSCTYKDFFIFRSLILTAVLLAAGAVLKFFAGSVINIGGMKPNFIIAMYCLAILLIRPSLPRAAVIGVLAGAVCQFFPGTPYINFLSEILGAVVMALLIRIPMQRNISSVVSTFLATLVSGGVYTVGLFAFTGAAVETLAAYVPIVLCTALINCVIVGVLYVPARAALRPKILVLDEPTGELDPGASEQIFRLLRRMNEAHGMTVIVVEQKIMLLSAYAKKLALLLSVTQMSDLSGVLVQRLHVPYKYAFTLTTAIRFIPVFADSLSGIMEAQTARGVAFDTKNPFKKLGLILPLCMPLLISSVGRIHDTAAAAEMRGFTLRTRESQSRRYTFKSGDLFAALIAAALVAAGALL